MSIHSSNLMRKNSANYAPNLVPFEDDDDYGDYYQLQLSYPYTKALTFSLYAAAIEPGDAFPDSNDDMAHELFFETNLAF